MMRPTTSTSWWKSSPWTLALCALMLVMNLGLLQTASALFGPWIHALQLDRQAVLHGQFWRLATGNLVHWSVEHFFLDVGAFLVVGLLYERYLGRHYPWILLGSALAVGCGVLLFRPDVSVYRGLSGVDSGQFAAALLVECRLAAREPRRWTWVAPVAAVFAFKILYECVTGQLLFGTESLGEIGLPTPVAHAAGAAAAIGLAIACSLLLRTRSRAAAHVPQARPYAVGLQD